MTTTRWIDTEPGAKAGNWGGGGFPHYDKPAPFPAEEPPLDPGAISASWGYGSVLVERGSVVVSRPHRGNEPSSHAARDALYPGDTMTDPLCWCGHPLSHHEGPTGLCWSGGSFDPDDPDDLCSCWEFGEDEVS